MNASVEFLSMSEWGFGRLPIFDTFDGVDMQGRKLCTEVEIGYTQKYGIIGIRHEELDH